jgi:long-chain fatty acid transport protein
VLAKARSIGCALGSGIAMAGLAASLPANASPLIDLVGSVGDNAGGQGVVSGPGAASTYWNPAMLMDADENVLLSFALLTQQIGVTLDGRDGGDVPLLVGQRNLIYPNSPSVPANLRGQPIPNDVVPTQWLNQGCAAGNAANQCPAPGFPARPRQSQGTGDQTKTYVIAGLVKRLIKDRLTFGFYGMVPISDFTTAYSFYPDEREALFSNSLHPELYGDRLTAVSIVLGAGLRLLPDLSVGVSFSVGLASTAASSSYVRNSTDYSTLLLSNSVDTSTSLGTTVGVYYKPIHWFRVGGTVKTPESFDLTTNISSTLPSGTQSGGTIKNVFDYMPWMIIGGVEADVVHRGEYTMSVTGSFKYAFWSSYVDRVGDSPSMYAGPNGTNLGWSATLSPSLGVRHNYKFFRSYIDLTYIPSPVPEQVGRSNYVDNDRVGAFLGGDFDVRFGTTHLRPGIQFFGDRLIYRYNQKDNALIVDELPNDAINASTGKPVPGAAGLQTNNTGWPGYASQGWVYGGMVTLGLPL